mmetsp:Transcript_100274/g.288075  ORF Transcript_100274/g.288075 Transcript_100274/m.288075 type:complete len:237 (+) Transcript_100274:812-1522(+)
MQSESGWSRLETCGSKAKLSSMPRSWPSISTHSTGTLCLYAVQSSQMIQGREKMLFVRTTVRISQDSTCCNNIGSCSKSSESRKIFGTAPSLRIRRLSMSFKSRAVEAASFFTCDKNVRFAPLSSGLSCSVLHLRMRVLEERESLSMCEIRRCIWAAFSMSRCWIWIWISSWNSLISTVLLGCRRIHSFTSSTVISLTMFRGRVQEGADLAVSPESSGDSSDVVRLQTSRSSVKVR